MSEPMSDERLVAHKEVIAEDSYIYCWRGDELTNEIDRLREQVEGMQVGVLKTARRHVSETDKLQAQLKAADAVCENIKRRTWAPPDVCILLDAYRATQKGGE